MGNKHGAAVDSVDKHYTRCHNHVGNEFVRVTVISEYLEEVAELFAASQFSRLKALMTAPPSLSACRQTVQLLGAWLDGPQQYQPKKFDHGTPPQLP
jgi:hypothetical protein